MSYDTERKRIAKEYVKEVRSTTFCVRCGKQPVDFHHVDHESNGNQRVAHLTALGSSLARIQQEIDKCEALCRSCHMKEDGRTVALGLSHPYRKGETYTDPQPCSNCGDLYKPLRKGLCNKCNHKKRAGKL